MRIKFIVGLCVMALVALAAGCAGNETATNGNTTSTTATTNTTTTTTTTSADGMRDAPDNSEINKTTDASGVTTETRTFKNNTRISRVVVTSRAGKRTAKVYSTSGEARDLPDNEVERALDNTGDAIADAAGFVADKSKEAVTATKEGAETVVDKTKQGTEKVAEKTVDVTKKVADKTADGAKNVGEKTVEGVKKTGEGAKKVGGKVKDAITP